MRRPSPSCTGAWGEGCGPATTSPRRSAAARQPSTEPHRSQINRLARVVWAASAGRELQECQIARKLATAAGSFEIRAGCYAYRDRRNLKRDMRALWITRITAAARQDADAEAADDGVGAVGGEGVAGLVGGIMPLYCYYLGHRREVENRQPGGVPSALLRCPFVMGILGKSREAIVGSALDESAAVFEKNGQRVSS